MHIISQCSKSEAKIVKRGLIIEANENMPIFDCGRFVGHSILLVVQRSDFLETAEPCRDERREPKKDKSYWQ